MELIGVLKSFDKLGRIVIPKELRERYSLDREVEIIATTDGVLIKNPKYKVVPLEDSEEKDNADF